MRLTGFGVALNRGEPTDLVGTCRGVSAGESQHRNAPPRGRRGATQKVRTNEKVLRQAISLTVGALGTPTLWPPGPPKTFVKPKPPRFVHKGKFGRGDGETHGHFVSKLWPRATPSWSALRWKTPGKFDSVFIVCNV